MIVLVAVLMTWAVLIAYLSGYWRGYRAADADWEEAVAHFPDDFTEALHRAVPYDWQDEWYYDHLHLHRRIGPDDD
jgi:hypothetical protein